MSEQALSRTTLYNDRDEKIPIQYLANRPPGSGWSKFHPRVLWLGHGMCGESNNHVVIGKEHYFRSADGLLMPTKKGQEPPDLKYFNPSRK